MSASEIIAEIQKLPAAEQEQVLAFLQREHAQQNPAATDIRYAEDSEFEKVKDSVLKERAELFRRLAK
jgi:hypothetical protein